MVRGMCPGKVAQFKASSASGSPWWVTTRASSQTGAEPQFSAFSHPLAATPWGLAPDQSWLPEQRLWVEVAGAGLARLLSARWLVPLAAPEAEIQVQFSQVPLGVELASSSATQTSRWETRYLADHILFLMKLATGQLEGDGECHQ